MAIKATINKISLNIADMDRHYYESHELTVAQHPSENNFRFLIRLVAFIFNASESLVFTKGMNSDEEADLWQKSLSDEIELWVKPVDVLKKSLFIPTMKVSRKFGGSNNKKNINVLITSVFTKLTLKTLI
jgi:YaeQ protein